MKQKDKALSRLFPKNCPQKVGEGKVFAARPEKDSQRFLKRTFIDKK